jgi:hypothetical protein
MRQIDDLQPGQKFKASEGLVWELDRLVDVTTAIPHVKMVGINDRHAYKIIAASVLLDERRFQAV